MDKLNLSHAGFKAYDIRGIVPDEVNEELAYRVGRAYADLYYPKPCASAMTCARAPRRSAKPQAAD